MAYRLEFPLELIGTRDVFHISMLKKHVPDPSHMIQHEHLHTREDATYMEKPMPFSESSLEESWAGGSYLGVARLGSYLLPEVCLLLDDQMSLWGEDVRFLILIVCLSTSYPSGKK